MVGPGRARRTWDAMRKAGGSIIDQHGNNLTGPTYAWGSFANYLDNLCYKDQDRILDHLKTIEEAARQGEHLARMNAVGTTNPKCYSKPVAKLTKGCRLTIEWRPRSGNEEDCRDPDA